MLFCLTKDDLDLSRNRPKAGTQIDSLGNMIGDTDTYKTRLFEPIIYSDF